MSDELKAIPLEERMARVKKAMAHYIGGTTAHDFAKLWEYAYEGVPFRVNTNSSFFKYVLMGWPEIVETLGSILSLTPSQVERIKGSRNAALNR